MNPITQLSVNLIDRYEHDENLLSKIKNYRDREGFNKESNDELNLSVNDTVCFIGGSNMDIMFYTKITGFDNNNKVLVLWSCYWFPVDPTDKDRKFYKIHEVTS